MGFTDYPPLGRFAVRDMRQTVAWCHQGHHSQGRRRKQDQGRTEGRQEEMKCWPGATRVHNTNSTNLQENVNTSFNFTTLLYVYNTRFYFFSQNLSLLSP